VRVSSAMSHPGQVLANPNPIIDILPQQGNNRKHAVFSCAGAR